MKFIHVIGEESYSENVFPFEKYINLEKLSWFRIHIFHKKECDWVSLQLDVYEDDIQKTYRIETYDTEKEAFIAKIKILNLIGEPGIQIIDIL